MCLRLNEEAQLKTKLEELENLVEATNAALERSTKENQVLEGHLSSIRNEHDRFAQQKIDLEEKILNSLQGQLSTNEVSKSSARNIHKLQQQRRDLEVKMYRTEEQLAEVMFELEKVKGEVSRRKIYADELKVGLSSIHKEPNEPTFNV